MTCVICQAEHEQKIILQENSLVISKCENCNTVYSNFRDDSKYSKSEDMIDAHKIRDSKMNIFKLGRFLINRYVFKITSVFDSEYIRKNINVKTIRTVLDIGAQYGFLVKNLSEYGIDSSGIEAFPHPFTVTKKINYVYFTENFDSKNTKYDLIILGDLLQIMPNPLKILEKIFTMLEKNGYLMVTTINPNCEYINDFITRTKNNYLTFVGKRGFEIICKENNCSLIRFDCYYPQLYLIKPNWANRFRVGVSFIKYFLKINNGFEYNDKGLRNYVLIKKE